eukprot:1413521-Pyramimonas_sp.AAC.1
MFSDIQVVSHGTGEGMLSMVRKQLASIGLDTRTSSSMPLVTWAPRAAALPDAVQHDGGRGVGGG